MSGMVGASIVEIITESLYDKPIVIFREYVQNSADSLADAKSSGVTDELSIQIWKEHDTLYFLDNGTGIPRDKFSQRMGSIAGSEKIRQNNIGYKGIGRLSGLSYCKQLRFINILDYRADLYQTYTIDCAKYAKLRKERYLNNIEFPALMDQIATMNEDPNPQKIHALFVGHEDMFCTRNTGFLVILDDISTVLSLAIKEKNFLEDLKWLLPVPFQDELLTPDRKDKSDIHMLFQSLGSNPAFSDQSTIVARAFRISYNGEVLCRPITRKMLREFVCRCDLERYAVCVHSFSNTGITIDRKNSFSGIRLYVDNMLLCDESELIPTLQQFGMLSHPVNETIQTVQGIGAVIYLVDKVSLSANARRTFIDVTDDDSLHFLYLVSEFVETVYQTRYALSNYNSAKRSAETTSENLMVLSKKAREALIKLAQQEIELKEEPLDQPSFTDLRPSEKKRMIKSKITKDINQKVKRYVEQVTDFRLDTYFEDFLTWLNANE